MSEQLIPVGTGSVGVKTGLKMVLELGDADSVIGTVGSIAGESAGDITGIGAGARPGGAPLMDDGSTDGDAVTRQSK